MSHRSILFRRCLHGVKRVLRRSSSGVRWIHLSDFAREMVLKSVEIGGSLDSARTASTGVERTRLVMALVASNCTSPSLLVVVADSQGAQAVTAYSSTLRTTAM